MAVRPDEDSVQEAAAYMRLHHTASPTPGSAAPGTYSSLHQQADYLPTSPRTRTDSRSSAMESLVEALGVSGAGHSSSTAAHAPTGTPKSSNHLHLHDEGRPTVSPMPEEPTAYEQQHQLNAQHPSAATGETASASTAADGSPLQHDKSIPLPSGSNSSSSDEKVSKKQARKNKKKAAAAAAAGGAGAGAVAAHHNGNGGEGEVVAEKGNGEGAGAGGPPARLDPLAFRKYGFWAPELAFQRKIFFKGYPPFLILLFSLVIWGFVAIYWASLSENNSYRLRAILVNGDPNGQIGQTIENAIVSSTSPSNPQRLGWQVRSASEFPTQESIEYNVAVAEDSWITVQVMDNATAALATARSTGDASWAPQNVIKVYYSQARNYQAAGMYTLQPTLQILNQAIAQLNPQLTASYLQSLTASGLATAQTNLVRAPQTIASPVGMTQLNLRPFNQTVAIATTFVGLIYMLILAFNVTMAFAGVRTPIQPYLKLKHLIALRFIVPLFSYVFVALSFAMLNLPFKLTFNMLGPNYAAGFFAFYACTFVGMTVLGLVTDILYSIVGQKFIGFALVLWIIVNVACANYPLETLNVFFRYGYAIPFYNLKQIFITIIFATGHKYLIIKYVGILFGWAIVCFISLPFWTWWEQKHAIKDKRAEIMRKRAEEEKWQEEGRKSVAMSRPASFHQHHYQQQQHGDGLQHRNVNGGRNDWDEEEEEGNYHHQGSNGGRAVQNRTPTPIFGKAE